MAAIENKEDKEYATVQTDTVLRALDGSNLAGAIDWTPAEERRAFWKQTLIVMPLIILGFFSLQLDRGNITQALTGTMLKDVGINQDQLNNGQTLLLLMIVIGEIPSNIVLVKIGAKWWLSAQMIAWGIVATAQCMVRSPGAYFATRCILGICESSFIPGAAYYISTLYTRQEQARMVAWFYFGNICGKGSSGLLASVFLKWQGKGGLPGWAWIFLIEGVMSIFIGIICLIFLPTSTQDCKTLLGFRLFTEREAHILTNRVIIDDPLKADPHSHFSKKNILLALGSWRQWCHSLYTIIAISTVTAVAYYNAQVIKALGFSDVGKANAMSSLGSWLQAPCTLIFGYIMDKTNYKGPCVSAMTVILIILDAANFPMIKAKTAPNKWSRYVVYELMVGFGEPFAVSGLWWVQACARTPIQRSMYSAMFVMSSNAGQAIGAQMFRKDDAPKYIKGFTAVLAIHCFVLVWTIGLTLQYVYSNKRNLGDAGKEATATIHGHGEHANDATEVRAVFKYPT